MWIQVHCSIYHTLSCLDRQWGKRDSRLEDELHWFYGGAVRQGWAWQHSEAVSCQCGVPELWPWTFWNEDISLLTCTSSGLNSTVYTHNTLWNEDTSLIGTHLQGPTPLISPHSSQAPNMQRRRYARSTGSFSAAMSSGISTHTHSELLKHVCNSC